MKLETIVVIVVGLFAIIGGMYKAGEIYLKHKRARTKRSDGFFSGDWHNEGDALRDDSHYISLKLTCSGGKVSGYFTVRPRKTEDWSNIDIQGRRRGKQVICTLTHLRLGKQSEIGKVILKRKDKTLQWKTLRDDRGLLPGEVLMFATLPVLI